MSFELTDNASNAASQSNVEPQIVLEIEGYDTIYGAISTLEIIRYGNVGLDYGDDGIVYGGFNDIDDQASLISFKAGTTTSIKQQLNSDKGSSESISSMRIALVDKDEQITSTLLTPDEAVSPAKDVLGRRCRIWLGFNDTAFKDDYIIIFRGNVDSVESKAGLVLININHPDSKKKGVIFTPGSTALNGSVSGSTATFNVDSTADFLDAAYVGPSGLADSTFEYLIRVDDEVIKYTGMTGTSFTGLTRGYLGTTAAVHANDADVNSIYRFTGNAIDIALKLMLSGWGDFFSADQALDNFVRISISETVSNSIFFSNLDVEQEYNITVGDFITTTGASNGANNVSLKEITEVVKTDDGSYIVIGGVTFVEENMSSALISFRSQYDTYPDGAAMQNDEVDIAEHMRIKNTFLSDDDHYDFRLDAEIELKAFLSEQVYNPLSAYSVPKNAQSSLGFHINALLPTSTIEVLDSSNVISAKDISLIRATTKNFFNTIVYKYEQSLLEPDKFLKTLATLSNDSLDRIDVGIRALTIESKGFREQMGGATFADDASIRRLNKFQFGAESLKPVRVNFQTGFNLEIGDIVLVDLADLKISDIKNGTRDGEPRLFEIINKELDIRTGKVTFELLDSNFSNDTRVGLISPSSLISGGVSTTKFNIMHSFNHPFGTSEYKMWLDLIGSKVNIRNSDFSIVSESFITDIQGNLITVSPALGFIPAADYIMELSTYDNQSITAKQLYAFMTDDPAFADDGIPYQMI